MRRMHVPEVSVGQITLDPAQSRHLRTVLRADVGDTIEVFDPAGRSASATIVALGPPITLDVRQVASASTQSRLTIASAIPKGERADWMVEKLCEIGVDRLIPLQTARSVVHPHVAKIERWQRVAIEAAKQSHRAGVMQIDPVTPLAAWMQSADGAAMLLSTRADAGDITTLPNQLLLNHSTPLTLLIGPEGGWTDDEIDGLVARGLTPVSLGPTILRIETAAILGAGLIGLLRSKSST